MAAMVHQNLLVSMLTEHTGLQEMIFADVLPDCTIIMLGAICTVPGAPQGNYHAQYISSLHQLGLMPGWELIRIPLFCVDELNDKMQ